MERFMENASTEDSEEVHCRIAIGTSYLLSPLRDVALGWFGLYDIPEAMPRHRQSRRKVGTGRVMIPGLLLSWLVRAKRSLSPWSRTKCIHGHPCILIYSVAPSMSPKFGNNIEQIIPYWSEKDDSGCCVLQILWFWSVFLNYSKRENIGRNPELKGLMTAYSPLSACVRYSRRENCYIYSVSAHGIDCWFASALFEDYLHVAKFKLCIQPKMACTKMKGIFGLIREFRVSQRLKSQSLGCDELAYWPWEGFIQPHRVVISQSNPLKIPTPESRKAIHLRKYLSDELFAYQRNVNEFAINSSLPRESFRMSDIVSTRIPDQLNY